jgi:LDH2 family malate/lactate/ureidoglycolate dehydrogenase
MQAQERVVNVDSLKEFSTQVLRKLKVPEDEAKITSDVLVSADLRGIESHGVSRLPRYAKRLTNRWIPPKARLTVSRETGVSLLMDGHNSLGQVVAYEAMRRCIEKARRSHLGFAAVTNSNHIGIAGYYAMMALKEDMIGLCMTNAWPLVVPTFGIAPILGTNPIAISVPARKEPPFVLDMATSVVPVGKMEVYQRQGKAVPTGWAINENGEPALDTETVMRSVYKTKRGGLLPLGGLEETAGYKGYGLSLLVDILSGILPNAAYGPYVGTPEDPKPSNIGHFFGAIDINAFTPVDEFKERMDIMIKSIKGSVKAKGEDRIYISGEKEWEMEKQYRITGIPLHFKVWESLRDLAQHLGVEFHV